jgi:hypothetical protein
VITEIREKVLDPDCSIVMGLAVGRNKTKRVVWRCNLEHIVEEYYSYVQNFTDDLPENETMQFGGPALCFLGENSFLLKTPKH